MKTLQEMRQADGSLHLSANQTDQLLSWMRKADTLMVQAEKVTALYNEVNRIKAQSRLDSET